jgi:antitoxin ParD1/3/4
MATVRKTITLTSSLDEWIKKQIADGGFTNDSEYIRDLVRRDQARKQESLTLKAAIAEGLASGDSPMSVANIWSKAEARHLSAHD